MRILEIEKTSEYKGTIGFKIVHQNSSIIKRGDFRKKMSNGVVIRSICCPEVSYDEMGENIIFFIRGTARGDDNSTCYCDLDTYIKISDAVNKLNNMNKYEDVYE